MLTSRGLLVNCSRHVFLTVAMIVVAETDLQRCNRPCMTAVSPLTTAIIAFPQCNSSHCSLEKSHLSILHMFFLPTLQLNMSFKTLLRRVDDFGK
ncbi:Efflux pump roqT [Fusarium oxysporum f. sp. albedinis]|jgi:hypothetical protein|nr:Efflux pump roqT [Fusarium oxysporum f. sp. albedinis]